MEMFVGGVGNISLLGTREFLVITSNFVFIITITITICVCVNLPIDPTEIL